MEIKISFTECVHHNLEKCQSCKILTDNSLEYVNKYFVPRNQYASLSGES